MHTMRLPALAAAALLLLATACFLPAAVALNFHSPTIEGQPVAFCMPAAVLGRGGSGTTCGQEVADYYCGSAGYDRAWGFTGPVDAPRTLTMTKPGMPRKSCAGAAGGQRCKTFVAVDCIRERVFDKPMLDGKPAPYCSDQGCGKAAADAFCFKNNTHTSSSHIAADGGKTFAKITCVV